MTVFHSQEAALETNVPIKFPNGYATNARVRRYRNVIDLASQTSTDTIVLSQLQAGQVFSHVSMTADTSVVANSISIGDATTSDRFLASTLGPTATTLVSGAVTAAQAEAAIIGNVTPILTTTGTLPATGVLIVDMFTSGV